MALPMGIPGIALPWGPFVREFECNERLNMGMAFIIIIIIIFSII